MPKLTSNAATIPSNTAIPLLPPVPLFPIPSSTLRSRSPLITPSCSAKKRLAKIGFACVVELPYITTAIRTYQHTHLRLLHDIQIGEGGRTIAFGCKDCRRGRIRVMYPPRMFCHCAAVVNDPSITIATATSCCGGVDAKAGRGKGFSPIVKLDGAAVMAKNAYIYYSYILV